MRAVSVNFPYLHLTVVAACKSRKFSGYSREIECISGLHYELSITLFWGGLFVFRARPKVGSLGQDILVLEKRQGR